MGRTTTGRELVLASGSKSRRQMMEAAGLTLAIQPADVDERAVRDVFVSGKPQADPADIAQVLAHAKAQAVSALKPEAVVIGSDQVLAMDGEIFDKPRDMEDARRRLLAMRGKTHQLHAAVAIAIDGDVVWSMVDTAHMTVRDFTPEFLGHHLAQTGDAILQSVGAYQLEGPGVQLFDKIKGDYFTILGMPLLPLLEELRARGFIES